MLYHACNLTLPVCVAAQSMKKLGDKSTVVKCRQVDVMVVKEVLDTARKNYTSAFGEEAPALLLDQAEFLPPPPQKEDDVTSW